MDEIRNLTTEQLKEAYLMVFKEFPPLSWIDYKSKFKNEREMILYCLENKKHWYEVIEPIEEGKKINYGGDDNA